MMISAIQIKALAVAVEMAGDWRGTLVGNPDPAPLQEFDAFMEYARNAVKQVRSDYRAACAARRQARPAPLKLLQRVALKKKPE